MKKDKDNAVNPTLRERTFQLETANKQLRKVIKEKNLITEALQMSETRYRSLVESTDDFIYLVNEKGEYLFMNNKNRSLYGLSPDEVMGRRYGEFHDKKKTSAFMDRVRQVFEIKGSLVQEHYNNGRHYLLTLSPVKRADGKVRAVTVVSKEITDQKKLETALVKGNEKLRWEQKRRIALSKKLIDILEEERHRIAGDLHDQVGQVLTSLKIDLENIHPEISTGNPALSKKIVDITGKATRVLGDIKAISNQLRPGILDAFGLEQALMQLLKELEQKSVKTQFFCKDVPTRFHHEKELALYRIAQEAIHNVMKHAGALKVHVNLTKRKGTLCLSVEDNGVGFNLEKSLASTDGKSPLGLLIMQERAFQQGGELTIDSAEGKGTHLLVEIPLGNIDD